MCNCLQSKIASMKNQSLACRLAKQPVGCNVCESSKEQFTTRKNVS